MTKTKTKKVKKETLTVASLEAAIKKRYGPKAIRRASDPSLQITRIPCGIMSIDYLLGGGFPRGRHVEIFGGYNVGKTYTAYRLIAQAQADGLRCCFLDIERTFDPVFAELAGVDLEELALPPAEHGNMAIDLMEMYIRSRLYDVIVLDSIAALLPKSELEKAAEDGSFGTAQAKMMSEALRKLTTANEDTVLVYINQTREAVGVMFGKRTKTSGGMAMGYYAGVRLEMVRTASIKKKARVVNPDTGVAKTAEVVKGHRVLVRAEKDKTGGARPYETTSFVFDYDTSAIDPIEDLLYLGRSLGFVHKEGAKWWMDDYEDEAQNGRAKFKKWLRKNRIPQEELRDWILDHSPDNAGEDEDLPDDEEDTDE